MTDDELGAMFGADDVTDRAILAETARRDRADRKAAAERQLQYEWYDAMHAQRMDAEAFCGGGGMLNHEALRRQVSEWDMWTGSWSQVRRYASEDLIWFFEHKSPRLTFTQYKRQRSAAGRIQREEWRDRDEISERGTDDHDHERPGMAGDEPGPLRHVAPACGVPQAPAGGAVQRGGHSHGDAEGSEDRTADGGAGNAMGLADMAVRGVVRGAMHAAQNGQQQAPQDSAPPAGKAAPVPADCSAELAAMRGLGEEDLQLIGQQILEESCQFINRFSVLPSRAAGWALGLWAGTNWIYESFTDTARMHITALTYGAGKTRVMELVNLLCPNPQMMAKITGPALYHIIDERHPAPLALDEADAIFGQGQRAEDLRGILNAGYKYNGTMTRVVKGEACDFSVFCPVIFAGKGKLPKSLEDRSVTIMMTQRKPGQQMDRFVPKMHEPMGRKTGLMLGAWATKVQGPAGDILWDDPPEGLADRQVDILTPMYALAQMAGGVWPERFAEIVDVLMLGGVSTDEVSPATALLAAIRDVWPEDTERLATHQLAELLAGHESGEFAWPEQVRTRELNSQMRNLGISPVPMRIGGTVMRGYDRESVIGGQSRDQH
jgi:Protein of unknown function (DUF3631)